MSALREAAALADKLEKLNRKYDAKIRKLESKFGNAKLDVQPKSSPSAHYSYSTRTGTT